MADPALEAARSDIRRGRYLDAVTKLSAYRASQAPTDNRALYLTLLAEVTQLTGDAETASTCAAQVIQTVPGAKSLTSRCQTVLGNLAAEAGLYARALRHYQAAIGLAREVKDDAQVARTQLRLLGALTDRFPSDSVSWASDVNKNVIRAGDVQLRADFHIVQGRLCGRRGLIDRALRHLDLARSLLQDDPSQGLEAVLHLDASALLGLASDYQESLARARMALACATASGHLRTHAAALANLGQILVYLGQFGDASALLKDTLTLAHGSREIRAACLDTLAQLQLSLGDWHSSEDLLCRAQEALPTSDEFAPSWYELLMQQTRIRLALKKGHHDSANRLATEATALADARSDRLLGALFRAMQADSLVALGRPDDAGSLVAEAQAMVNGSSLATLAEIERVRATVHASLGEQDEAADHFHRAVRLLTGVGSFLAKREAAQALAAWYPEAAPDSRGNGGQVVAGRASGTLDWPPAPLQVHPSPSLDAASVESLAVLFPYASKPGVLGREVAALIARLDCASSIELRVHQPDGRDEVLERREHGRSTAPTTAVDIDAGSSRGRRYVVRVVPCNRLGARGAVTAVKQLAESAVALETARREEKERTSLWPGDVDLEDAGGLFVSGVMRELLANAHRVAASNVPVLLTGESGVGKEVIAREIHRRSPYAKGPFVPFNCTAAPRDMLDSQLFGHRRGAFTGALEHAPGIIRAAQGGTLFLDEIGELGLDSQPKLLRFLDSKEVFPIGEARPVHVDVRVIAATNAKLEQLLVEGRFREDLYYRLAIATLHVPPLRERREEIPAFVNHFLELYAREAKRAPLGVTEEALEYLVLYRWPGNVRQLAAEMRRVALTAESGGNLTPELLSSEIRASRRTVDATQPIASPNELLVRIDQPLQVSLDQIERAAIERALAESRGRVEKAATLLRISRKGLFLKRRRLGLPIAER